MRQRLPWLLCLALLLPRCGGSADGLEEEAAEAEAALRRESGGEFFGRPFPDDSRCHDDGSLDLSGFPNPGDSVVLDNYLAKIGSATRGWGTNGVIYLPFTGPLDPASLPPGDDVRATLGPAATVYLVDVDEASPERGRRIPFRQSFEAEATPFLPPNVLILDPVLGFPLRGATTYAAVVTTGVLDAAGRPLAAVEGAEKERLGALGLDTAGIAGAAVLTTQDVITAMERLREVVADLPEPIVRDWRFLDSRGGAHVYEGTLAIPSFQVGESPFRSEGGEIIYDDDGAPIVQGEEVARISLAIPQQGRGISMPRTGWPLLLYSHGTGGDYLSGVRAGAASEAAQRGFATLGFDQVVHGTRVTGEGFPPELAFFNLNNIVASRDNVRQGGVDGLYLMRLGRADGGIVLRTSITADGRPAFTDPESIVFLGHSQGGITGAPLVAVERDLLGAGFSGTGSILRLTVLERKDVGGEPLDFEALARSMLGLADDDRFGLDHPVLTLLQTFIEPADPINYAPYFTLETEGRKPPTPVLILEGFNDQASPAGGIEAFIAAAGADLVEPVARRIEALDLRGREPVERPVWQNVNGATLGAFQYPDQGHFALFDEPVAALRMYDFLRTAAEGDAAIE